MTTPLKSNFAQNPHWITFWRRVRAAAQELDRIEAEQTAGEPHSVLPRGDYDDQPSDIRLSPR